MAVENDAVLPRQIVDELVIRPLEHDELELYGRSLNPDRSLEAHRIRIRLQDEDTAAYMFAWHEDEPVGHGLLIWNGPIGNPKQHLPLECPYIEDLWVAPSRRSQGIGSAMVQMMESLAAERGYTLIGLSVGIDNMLGMQLYRRLGFVPLSVPTYTLSGVLQDASGELTFWSEECQYMRKSITMATGTLGGVNEPRR